jgi:hypothetical protein
VSTSLGEANPDSKALRGMLAKKSALLFKICGSTTDAKKVENLLILSGLDQKKLPVGRREFSNDNSGKNKKVSDQMA